MTFVNRRDAGEKLGKFLLNRKVEIDLVLGLPRGGVVVAREVADILHKPLDVMVVRKLGLPGHAEYAVGAIAEGGVEIYDDKALAMMGLERNDLKNVLKEEKARLQDYARKFHYRPMRLARHLGGGPANGGNSSEVKESSASRIPINNQSILLVDDGIATGLTAQAAIRACRKLKAKKVLIAAPVASTSAADELKKTANDVYFLHTDPFFQAVAQYYEHFAQTTDDEVIALLRSFRSKQ